MWIHVLLYDHASEINADGLKQIDISLSMVFVCTAVIMLLLLCTFEGRYGLGFAGLRHDQLFAAFDLRSICAAGGARATRG